MEARVRSQASPCEIRGGHSGIVISFSPSISIFPCHCHSTNVPYTFSSAYCCYQKNKWAKPGNLPKRNPLSENGARWIENKFHFWVFERNSSHFLCYAAPAMLSSLLKECYTNLSLYLLQLAAWPWHHRCVTHVTGNTAEDRPVRTNTWFVQTAEILGKIVRRWRDEALCRVCSNADMRLGSIHVWWATHMHLLDWWRRIQTHASWRRGIWLLGNVYMTQS